MADTINKDIGRVVGIYGPRVDIFVGEKAIPASVRGRLKYGESGESVVAVGDYVDFSTEDQGWAAIDHIHERARVISRPAVEKVGAVQVIVANVDRMIIVTSTANPDFKPGAVDRFLVIAFKEGIKPVVVINKIDLANPGDFHEHTEAWRKIGCVLLYTSAKTGEHINELGELLRAGTSVIVGHSGVGKSSLLNRINPALHLKIGDVSAYSGKGKHTTSRVNLYRIFPKGWVADTPGLRDLGLIGVTKKNLHHYYPEFKSLEQGCQFSDCAHVNEPRCAVKDAVATSDFLVSPLRYRNYLSIYKSLGRQGWQNKIS